jgi:hypothetical protein
MMTIIFSDLILNVLILAVFIRGIRPAGVLTAQA